MSSMFFDERSKRENLQENKQTTPIKEEKQRTQPLYFEFGKETTLHLLVEYVSMGYSFIRLSTFFILPFFHSYS